MTQAFVHPLSDSETDTESLRRVVVKLGTQVVMDADGGLNKPRLAELAHEMAALHRQGVDVLVVSSGAVGLGRQALKLMGELTLDQKQACAAVGQSLLMEAWRLMLDCHGITTAQVLVTATDFSHRQRYLNLSKTLNTLLDLRVVPIINENDTVSTAELEAVGKGKSFGDNDKLSALVASKLQADLLVIFTNVDGIYEANPLDNPDAKRLERIDGFDRLSEIDTDGQSAFGRGGMGTKIEAARIAAISGVCSLIASGSVPKPLTRLLTSNRHAGTLVVPQASWREKQRWVGLVSGYQGVVVINEGARKALLNNNASLLPAGVVAVQGEFHAGDVLSIQDEHETELGRGVTHFSSQAVRLIQGRHSKEIPTVLAPLNLPAEALAQDEVIHRDHLVMFHDQL